MTNALFESQIPGAKLLFRGKVRDVYDLGNELLIVTTDRLSAFDVILPDPIPFKGQVLTSMTDFWMKRFKGLLQDHTSLTKLESVVTDPKLLAELKDRSVIVRKAKPLPIECIVRGYLFGSGYNDYKKTGMMSGIKLRAGMQEAQKLDEALFTPSTKAEQGQHDENISFEQARELVGKELIEQVRDVSIKLYSEGARFAETKGIIICDTKFEFGLIDGKLTLIDEVLTPDSSRFWPKASYAVGMSPPSFDKQFVRDYLIAIKWDKKPPAPKLPADIIQKTSEKYREALHLLTES
jgi:phosphoribosylaminoimidazole-succinocarboxamide synthase